MIRRRPTARPGYTLLEVLLASAIALLLLAALYATLDVTLTRMDVSRDQVNSNDLSRAVVNRMTADLSASLGVMPPKSGVTAPEAASGTAASPSTPAAGAGSGTMGTSSGTGAGGTGTDATGAGTTGSTADTGTADDPSQVAVDIPLQAGVVGTDKQVSVFLSRVPTALTDPAAGGDAVPADLRRVTYYLAGDGGGLCRQERPWVTADGVRNSSDPDRSAEAADVIAPEVKDATFEYFDGGSWVGSWAGTDLGTDGVTPLGPPRAIRVTLVLEFVGRGGAAVQKRVQHVFAVRAAAGTYQPDVPAADAAGTTTGGM